MADYRVCAATATLLESQHFTNQHVLIEASWLTASLRGVLGIFRKQIFQMAHCLVKLFDMFRPTDSRRIVIPVDPSKVDSKLCGSTLAKRNPFKIEQLFENDNRCKVGEGIHRKPSKIPVLIRVKRPDIVHASKPIANATKSPKPRYLSPKQALKQYKNKLSAFEQQEINSFSEIYFVGPLAQKRQGVNGAPYNGGYDDNHGGYIMVQHDHLAYRYEILKVIGKGSFGQVAKVYDHKFQKYVALKVARYVNAKQVLEEIRILEHLKKQDTNGSMNVIHMLENFTFRNHICITFELLSMDLYELMKKNKFHGFSMHLVRTFAHSILQCLEALHRNKIIHCDLKPENILLKQEGLYEIKVIDFGCSCFEHKTVYTYIQTRNFRAPEVILGSHYGMPIDMWSFGCILAELLTGIPLFAGEDEGDQIARMIELLGIPSPKLIQSSKRAGQFLTSDGYPQYCTITKLLNGRTIVNGSMSRGGKMRGAPGSKHWITALKGCKNKLFIDFLKNCLKWDPDARMTPSQALRHEWIAGQQPKHPVTEKFTF
ncbi:dual specificity tyrosine-phosphorylation-regulated kinase 2-like [Pelobates fuscus]|uniref:dual specificity tyrosine-phosphorylation-regulated kinase 2-like n=1 Tax=Pelobates fuscus TaxID=191477 RepID=UPI002FE4CFBC